MLRSLLVAGIIFSLLPLCFLRPWVGVLVWTWISYMNPHRLAYGFAYDFPFALLVGGATLVGLLMTKDRRPVPATGLVYILVTLWIVFFCSSVLGPFYPEEAWTQFDKVSKILLMTFVTMMVIRTRDRLTLLFAVVALSLGFYGVKGGIWSIATGGQNQVLGPPGSFLGGNTEIGLALNMNMPILFFLRRHVARRWLRLLMLAALFLTAVASLMTYSRGAMLGLVAVIGYLAWTSRKRFLAIILLAVVLPLGAAVAPEKWTERMQTIRTYNEDESAMGRIRTWILSTRVAADRPLLGGGFRCLTAQTTRHYMPESPDSGFDAHNVFFQVLAEHGYIGLAVFTALLLSTGWTLRGIRRRVRGRSQLDWAADKAQMMQGCLLAYTVSGFFLSLSYFDLYYLIVAATVILQAVVEEQIRGETMAPEAATPEPETETRPGLRPLAPGGLSLPARSGIAVPGEAAR